MIYFSIYSLVFVSIKNTYQTLKKVFRQLSKHLEFCQKYSAAHRILNSLLGVWISWWNTDIWHSENYYLNALQIHVQVKHIY